MLPTKHFSFHHHLRFNPRPQGPQCNCGTWQIWCLPPHLGGCGHIYVQDMLYCGLTVDEDEPAKAMATVCPGVVIRRPIKSAGLMMGLCPSCRNDRVVVQVRHTCLMFGLDMNASIRADVQQFHRSVFRPEGSNTDEGCGSRISRRCNVESASPCVCELDLQELREWDHGKERRGKPIVRFVGVSRTDLYIRAFVAEMTDRILFGI